MTSSGKLGGSSPEMIYRHYGHILSGHLERAAETLHAKLAGRKSTGK